jgi:hypothetical protein
MRKYLAVNAWDNIPKSELAYTCVRHFYFQNDFSYVHEYL